jgi:sortase A
VTVAVVVALFAIYQLWWTNVAAAADTGTARTQARESFDRANQAEAVEPADPVVGDAFALMYIPRLRPKAWDIPVVQGVAAEQLRRGVGHYPATALPGAVGNVGIAGHRATNGEPLADVDQLRAGDDVIIKTATSWFTYTIERDRIVDPTDVWVIEPQPFPNDPLSSDRILTLTTCHPRWGSTYRWIFWAALTDIRPASGPAPEQVT